MLTRSSKNGYLCISEFSGKAFRFSLLHIMLAMVHQKWPFICWNMFTLYQLWRVFFINGILYFVKCFFSIYWDNHVVFNFPFVYAMCQIDGFGDIYLCIPDINPIRLWCMIFLYIVFSLLLLFCWGFLHLWSSEIMTCNFFFVESMYSLISS